MKNHWRKWTEKLRYRLKTVSPPHFKIFKSLPFEDLFEKFYSPSSRPLIHRLFLLAFFISSPYFLGKLAALLTAPISSNVKGTPLRYTPPSPTILADLQEISKRNLFKKKGPAKPKSKMTERDRPCLASDHPSSSSLILLNTVVLQNRSKSVAMTKRGGQREIKAYREGDQIPSLGKIGRIEASRMVFFNPKNGQCEFVSAKGSGNDLVGSTHLTHVLSKEKGKELLDKEKMKKSVFNEGNHFKIKRSYLNESLENLPDLLSQAQAVPIRNADGTLSFKVMDIDPGSIFSKLGIQNDDKIKSIDGRPIRNQGQILGLFNSLKKVKKISLTVMRDGTEQKLEYSFID
ncbi:MAG: PDZ domain-containing protein [Bacteriovoracales bacterium]|nr:PDZ domain-containing protein [Bacteriovoracales bacterium]